MASIKLKGDTSGELTIQAPSVAGTNTLDLPASSGTLLTTTGDGSQLTGLPNSYAGMKNLIINGDMAIDQRNAGASATSNSTVYMVDRYQFQMSGVTNVQTYQQVTDAPAGFNKSLKITNNSTTQATAVGVLCTPRQKIEGLNTAYLNWGTSDAQTVTVSFWVKASVTGTYPVALTNNDFSRSFVTNYTVSVANTWEYKTVTIAGDTSGTWTVDTTIGINVMFSLDTGSAYQTTAGSWQAGNYRGTSSDVHFLANASATWQITGVQLEVGTTATDFEHRLYGMEFDLCRRYAEVYSGGSNEEGSIPQYFAQVDVANRPEIMITYYPKRTGPTLTLSGNFNWNSATGSAISATYLAAYVGTFTRGSNLFFSASGVAVNSLSGIGCIYFGASGGGKIIIDAEL